MKQQKILIDGYNLIKGVPIFNEIIEKSLLEARRNLEMNLTIYSKRNNISVGIYYDGDHNIHKSKQHNSGPLEIFYSLRPQKADDMIMDVIVASHGARWLRVVTSDREIQQCAKRHRIKFVGSKEFADELEQRLNVPKRKERKLREEDPNWIPKKGETEEWLNIFDSQANSKSRKVDRERDKPDIDPDLLLSNQEVDMWDTIFKNQKKNSDSPNDHRS
tara:strand:+ start:1093 stop:1746 length:654 start_codon:yes stop_codon:yes gene_type:complete